MPMPTPAPITARPGFSLVVDVSHAQPSNLDWAAVKAAGAVGAIVKATEGETFVDPSWRIHTTAAARAGLMVGSYHVFRPEHVDARVQAQQYWGTAWDRTMLCPILDLELGEGVSDAVVAVRAAVFVEESVKLWGKSAGLVYASPSFIERLAGSGVGRAALERMAAAWGLWTAQYGVARDGQPRVPWPWEEWMAWQFAGGEALSVGAASVKVDTSWFVGDEKKIALLGSAKSSENVRRLR